MNNKNYVYNIRDIFSIRDLLESSCELFADNTAFLFHSGDTIREITYSGLLNDVRAFATYLNSIGLEGKTIAVSGKNSYHWALTYLAVCCGTGVIMPVDKDLRTDELDYLFSDSGASAIVYSDDMSSKLGECSSSIRRIPMSTMDVCIEEGAKLIQNGDTSYNDHVVDPFALGILLYTSGTTGLAKGVMLSQNNIASNIIHVLRSVKLGPEDRTLSVLPLHHTYECMSGFLSFIYSGASIAYNDSLKKLQSDFLLFKPTVFICVPLLLENMIGAVMKKYHKIKGGAAIYAAQRTLASTVYAGSYKMRRKVFSAVNASFGGKLTRILCGAAALSPSIYNNLELFGYKVYVGYGLTETSPVCIMHNDFYSSPYDIGYPLVGVRAKLIDVNEDGIGELAIKGPNVMLGYYKNPEETSRVISKGWFYTGDLACKTEKGTYRITGRIKSMIVADNGKKIFPEELEYYLSESAFVSECMVYGKREGPGMSICVAIYPNSEAVDEALAKEGILPDSEQYDIKRHELFSGLVKEVNRKFPNYKAIRHIVIRNKDFVKTTTRKIKRNAAENIEE